MSESAGSNALAAHLAARKNWSIANCAARRASLFGEKTKMFVIVYDSKKKPVIAQAIHGQAGFDMVMTMAEANFELKKPDYEVLQKPPEKPVILEEKN
jgi:hypothetical protein